VVKVPGPGAWPAASSANVRPTINTNNCFIVSPRCPCRSRSLLRDGIAGKSRDAREVVAIISSFAAREAREKSKRGQANEHDFEVGNGSRCRAGSGNTYASIGATVIGGGTTSQTIPYGLSGNDPVPTLGGSFYFLASTATNYADAGSKVSATFYVGFSASLTSKADCTVVFVGEL
jgi:hypothetical protein